MQFLSVYLHIPFCNVRCHYCAFNIYTDHRQIFDAYIDAVKDEISRLASGQPVHSIYFGGGTPSLLTTAQIARLLDHLRAELTLTADCEITLEANPGDVPPGFFADIRSMGINRLSLGMQSAHTHELALFGRDHTPDDLPRAFNNARHARFDNISLDLIYGVPHQTLADWQTSLDAALELAPDHFSLYALQLEAGTELARRVKYGELPVPDDDLAADMYDLACQKLTDYEHYEISTWGRKRSRHNIQYWRNLPYLGIGAGAHGCANGLRTVNVMRPDKYIQRLANANEILPYPRTPATQSYEVVSPPQERFETIMLGLRQLIDGLSYSDYQDRYGEHLRDQYGSVIDKLIAQGLVREESDRLLLTRRAWLIANRVLIEFLPEPA
jgi:oxygen-independent coproporphyrinogen-3 oxidase